MCCLALFAPCLCCAGVATGKAAGKAVDGAASLHERAAAALSRPDAAPMPAHVERARDSHREKASEIAAKYKQQQQAAGK